MFGSFINHHHGGNFMRKTIIGAAVVGFSMFGLVAPAHAGPTDPRSNTGYCVSDFFYGNQPNEGPDGHPIPSQSPGPKVTNPVTGEVTVGNSIGDYNSGRATGTKVNIPQLCHAAVS